ncbi:MULTISPECIES: dihydropteroate synthase [unclassified Brevundimonas]|uniref:dihydropteroate synthase n=1 Tax=unclassified Brevundimonas TaxID=2622653 RepID=UPI0025BA5ED4|nr:MULTISPECIES: dihydropteroate synthase [unclassified Brevundimonas]
MTLNGLLNARRRPLVMGIVNVTPDSFSDGGHYTDVQAALAHARQLIADGADVLDIGGESTRPGSDPVSAEEEIARVVPVIEALRAEWDGIISIDTMKPQVARAAVAAGATVWNDVTGLGFDADSPATAAELGVDVILMHMKGAPKTMQDAPIYDDVTADVMAHLAACAELAVEAGVEVQNIWLDPGIGFAKTTAHNLRLTADLPALCALGYPVLYAASRKRMIAEIDPTATLATDRLGGTLALHLEAVRLGADMVRVHDVRETVQALKVQAALQACAEAL